MQGVSIESFLLVNQFSWYWKPAAQPGNSRAPESAAAAVAARGPNAIVQPLDCSLRVAMQPGDPEGGSPAAVVEAAAIVQAVDIGLHHHQVHRLPKCSRLLLPMPVHCVHHLAEMSMLAAVVAACLQAAAGNCAMAC